MHLDSFEERAERRAAQTSRHAALAEVDRQYFGDDDDGDDDNCENFEEINSVEAGVRILP